MSKRRTHAKVKTGVPVLVVVAIAFAVVTVWQCSGLYAKNEVLDDQLAVIQKQIDEQNVRADELSNQEAYMKTDAYIEDVAHQKLGLVYPDELYITPTSE